MRRILILALGTAFCSFSLAWGGLVSAAPSPAPAATKAPAGDPTIAPKGWVAPRTAFGQPDISGYWSNATMTPFTRNAKLTNKATLSLAEARAAEKVWGDALAAADAPTEDKPTGPTAKEVETREKLLALRPDFAAAGGDVGGYNTYWIDPGTHIMEVNGEFRSSILTTPNGLPPVRKAGAAPPYGRYRDSYESYEVRGLGDRCIMGFGRNAGPPMLPNGYYNNDYYIIQTPDAVVIQVEMIHEARIVRLTGGHRPDDVRPWMGDSIGHWEGNTLVVETTNFAERDGFMGSWKHLKVTEHFTRVTPTRVNYQFTLEDPDTWDKPWGGEYNFAPLHGIVYEYACHEGNYALPAIRAGARRQEQEAAAAAAKAKPGGK